MALVRLFIFILTLSHFSQAAIPASVCLITYRTDDPTKIKLCNGAMISKYYLITAGHCEGYWDSRNPTEVTCGEEHFGVTERRQHPLMKVEPTDGKFFPKNMLNDLAVLKLSKGFEKVPFSLPRDRAELLDWIQQTISSVQPGDEVKTDFKYYLFNYTPQFNSENLYTHSAFSGHPLVFDSETSTFPQWLGISLQSPEYVPTVHGHSGSPVLYASGNDQWSLLGLVVAHFNDSKAGLIETLSTQVEWLKAIINQNDLNTPYIDPDSVPPFSQKKRSPELF